MLVLFLLQIILIALNAVFACAEIAVLSINETKLERMADQGDKRAKRLFHLTSFWQPFRWQSHCLASWVPHLRRITSLIHWWIG